MSTKKISITIFGAGYVGLTTAVLFANSGIKVNLIEIDQKKLETLKNGKSFFYEHGIDELLKTALKNNIISITNNPKEALVDSNLIFSCVGTPDNPDGSSNLSYVQNVAETVLSHAQEGATFIQKSTVPVGTGENIEHQFNQGNKQLHYVSNPEFLREGTAIQDTLWFDRIVVGGNNKDAVNSVINIYKKIEANRDRLSKKIDINPIKKAHGKYIKTSRNSAELTKVTANAFLALKISFANSIAKLADESNVDINEVMDAVGADRRITRDFLNAGRGYGGGCFPKDVSAIITSSAESGVDMSMLIAASAVNDSMPGYIANKARKHLGDLRGKRIAVLGLSFKANTSDARKSPGVKIANILSKAGAHIRVYDPRANYDSKHDLRTTIQQKNSAYDATKSVDAIFITTDWPEFINLNIANVKSNMRGNLFVDAINKFNPKAIKKEGLHYIGVGRS